MKTAAKPINTNYILHIGNCKCTKYSARLLIFLIILDLGELEERNLSNMANFQAMPSGWECRLDENSGKQ